MEELIQQLINGLTIGSVYALIALGYTMVYGIIELINFAHGEIYMIGAFLGIIFLAIFGMAGIPLVLGLILAFVLSMGFDAAYGYSLEKLAYKPLRVGPRLAPLITALGMSLFFQDFIRYVQGNRDLIFPVDLPNTGINLANLSFLPFDNLVITYKQIGIFVVALAMMGGLEFYVKNTRMGKAMRCTAQDKTMSSLLGIKIDKVISATFIIGSGLAAVAGLMVAMYYHKVNFFIGFLAGLKAFIAAVLGGIGNIRGAFLGGLLLGMAEALAAGYIGGEWKDIVAFGILFLVLVFKPSGLLGSHVTEKV